MAAPDCCLPRSSTTWFSRSVATIADGVLALRRRRSSGGQVAHSGGGVKTGGHRVIVVSIEVVEVAEDKVVQRVAARDEASGEHARQGWVTSGFRSDWKCGPFGSMSDSLPRSPRSKHGGANVRFPPPLVFVGFILAGVAVQRFALPLASNAGSMVRAGVGAPLIGGGLALILWAAGGFRRSGRSPEPWLPSSTLILEGPYRFSRNPMYVGMTAIQVGVGAALDNGWVVLLAASGLAVVQVMAVRPEERYLEETFGADYVALKKRVRRYL